MLLPSSSSSSSWYLLTCFFSFLRIYIFKWCVFILTIKGDSQILLCRFRPLRNWINPKLWPIEKKLPVKRGGGGLWRPYWCLGNIPSVPRIFNNIQADIQAYSKYSRKSFDLDRPHSSPPPVERRAPRSPSVHFPPQLHPSRISVNIQPTSRTDLFNIWFGFLQHLFWFIHHWILISSTLVQDKDKDKILLVVYIQRAKGGIWRSWFKIDSWRTSKWV